MKPTEIERIEGAFDEYLARVTDQAGDITLPNGIVVPKVPFSLHWLVVGGTFVGELSFRHRLNDWLRASGGHIGYGIRPSARGRGFGRAILRLALVEARALGLPRVLVTAHAENTPSRRIIEANGGTLENIVPEIFTGEALCRYWIELEPAGGAVPAGGGGA